MLADDTALFYKLNDLDRQVFGWVLPEKHPLLDALAKIPWENFIPELESYYCRDRGQPAIPPLLLLKLEYLRYAYHLSDVGVISRAQTDMLFRWFLQLPIKMPLPDPSLLCKFRGRLGAEGFKKVFDRLVGFAREAGLVRDRLRLKDASHVIANIAVPTTLQLLAQLRNHMLAAISKIDPLAAAGFEIEAERIREETDAADDAAKLAARLALVQDILHWICRQEEPPGSDDPHWKRLQAVRELAEKITDDVLHPGKGHRTLSVVDPDARRGKHGDFFDGYLIDVMMDADSEIVTEIEVLPADGDEAQDTVHLVEMEQETHGNQIEQLSIDGIGFNGEMLRNLEGPEGLGVDVITVPRDFNSGGGYPASMFELSEDGKSVTCPANRRSSYRNGHTRNGTTFQFKKEECAGCQLLAACNPKMIGNRKRQFGRSVTKNEYAAEYERAREKAKTPEYAEVRRRHPAIERKINDIARHQKGRFARYWGRPKVAAQEYMTGFAVNIKRIIRLLAGEVCAAGG